MKIFLLLALFLLSSCARSPLKNPELAMRPVTGNMLEFSDSLSLESLREAFRKNLVAFSVSPVVSDPMRFGERLISKMDYLSALSALEKKLTSFEEFTSYLRENFSLYEIYGDKEWGDVFTTGYYEPRILGSKKKTAKHSQALYAVPNDMVSIDLGAYAEKNPDFAAFLETQKKEQKSRSLFWRGRLEKNGDGSLKILPYFERKEIDGDGKLQTKKLEIAWVDPIDAFFLQIQGSGVVEFSPKEKIRVGYAAQNGAPYVAIGKFLLEHIPLEEMSMQKIVAHLRSLPFAEQQKILHQNPSYVFFQKLKTESLGYMGAEVTAGRTIATDQGFFPKGALAFLQIELPKFADPKAIAPEAWEARNRFVFDQDTGGAIRGGGRADLFMGGDELAAQNAGVMKRSGKLYYLVPKEKFLAEMK